MADASFEELEVVVDDLGLSLLGWQIQDARARLTTRPDYKGFRQELTVSGTAYFIPEDWSDRFVRSDDDRYPPALLLKVTRPKFEASPIYVRIDPLRYIGQVRKRAIRFSETMRKWQVKQPLTAHDITVGVTAFDLDEGTIRRVELPLGKTSTLPVDFVDETTRKAFQMKVNVMSARVYRRKGESSVHLHTEGSCGFGSVDELFVTHLADTPNRLRRSGHGFSDEAPFEVELPEVEFELLDETGFILERQSVDFDTTAFISVDANGGLPRREPRWILQRFLDVEDLPGMPARACIRFVDPDII